MNNFEQNPQIEEYLSLELLADYLDHKKQSNNNLESYNKFVEELKKEDSQNPNYYDLILLDLNYLSLFSNESLFKDDIKNIKNNLPVFESSENKEKILKILIRKELMQLLDINEDLLKTVFFYYKKFQSKYNLSKDDLLSAYKDLLSQVNPSMSLSDYSALLFDYYKKKEI